MNSDDQKSSSNRGSGRLIMILITIALVIGGSWLAYGWYQRYQSQQTAMLLEQQARERLVEINANRNLRTNAQEMGEIPPERSNYFVPRHLLDLAIQNPDFVGVITIPALNQSYPVVQGKDNDFYLNHDFYGNYSQYGAIYVDYRVDLQDRAPHIILYGHNMLDGQMFGSLTRLASPANFNAAPQIIFDTIYGTMDFFIFSTHVVNYTETSFLQTQFNLETYQAFITRLNTISSPEVIYPATINNRLISLVTCNDYNYETQRFLAHGILRSVTQQP